MFFNLPNNFRTFFNIFLKYTNNNKYDFKYYEKIGREFVDNMDEFSSSYTNTMMVELGETLHFAAGSDKNIKLTTKDDLEMFKAYIKADKDNWLK